jgi:sec-independent protein translocase protein TatA
MSLPDPVLALVFSPMQMLIILVVALLLFGKRIPTMMRSLGSSVTEFKKGIKEGEEGTTTPEERS